MALVRPTVGADISAEAFGQPVFDQLIQGGAFPIASWLMPGGTVAAGVNTNKLDRTFTVGPTVAGLLIFQQVWGNTTSATDSVIINSAGTQVAIASITGASVQWCQLWGFVVAVGGSVRVRVNVYPWGGQPIALDGTRQNGFAIPVSANLSGTAFPTA